VLAHGDLREAQGHEQSHAERRQEEADADGGGLHNVEMDGVDAELGGDGKDHGNEHDRGGQALEHHESTDSAGAAKCCTHAADLEDVVRVVPEGSA
jgi:hypothetical protein